jgi:hypothetical protein
MLSVSLDLAVLAAMLFGIVLPANPKEVDSLNSPTTQPFLGGSLHLGVTHCLVKRANRVLFLTRSSSFLNSRRSGPNPPNTPNNILPKIALSH